MRIFTFIGIATTVVISSIIVWFVVRFIWSNLIKKYIYPTLANLWIAVFGIPHAKGNYLRIWVKGYAHKPGTRKHFKSWKCLRRLAYRKLVLEARKERHAGV